MYNLQTKVIEAIQKAGWDIEIYSAIYNKCLTPQKLTGDEYHSGMHLREIGLMDVTFTPVIVGGRLKGNVVTFKSVNP